MRTIFTFLLYVCALALSAQNVGIGTTTPNSKLTVEGETTSLDTVLRAQVNYQSPADIPAIAGRSETAPGWGIGLMGTGGYIGVNGISQGASYTGTAYGVRGLSYGTMGTRIGIYGYAAGGQTNWAGYFAGKGKFTDQLQLDNGLDVTNDIFAHDYIYAMSSISVNDTVYTKDVYTPFAFQPIRIGAGRDIYAKIDGGNDGGYASAFYVHNGTNQNCFAVDENGNARTFGTHYIDDLLGVGTTSPSQKLDVDNGNLIVQGTNSFQGSGDAGIVYLGGIHHYIKGEYGFGVKIGTYAVGDALMIKEISGNVGIGATPHSGYKLAVNGKIIGEELRIQDSGDWPDYVFRDDYALMPLDDLRNSIQMHGHLPGIPSAEKVMEEGIAVGEMQKRMMEKIEELTLYVLSQHEEIQAIKRQVAVLNSQMNVCSCAKSVTSHENRTLLCEVCDFARKLYTEHPTQ